MGALSLTPKEINPVGKWAWDPKKCFYFLRLENNGYPRGQQSGWGMGGALQPVGRGCALPAGRLKRLPRFPPTPNTCGVTSGGAHIDCGWGRKRLSWAAEELKHEHSNHLQIFTCMSWAE